VPIGRETASANYDRSFEVSFVLQPFVNLKRKPNLQYLILELQYIVLYLCVLIVFSLRRESLKLILVDELLPEVVLSQI
jgi:hypothetical protein